MKITRRQLRRLIRESLDLVTEAYIESERLSDDAVRLAGMKKINWAKCGLPDAAAWQTYTANSVKQSMKKSDINAANQQFEGAVTVPIYWESLVMTADAWVEKEAAVLETHDWWHYNSGFKKPGGYVEFYTKHAGGGDMHAKEFNKLFFDTFMTAYKEGMVSGHSMAAKKRATPAALSALRKDMEAYLAQQIQAYIDDACIPPEFGAWFEKETASI